MRKEEIKKTIIYLPVETVRRLKYMALDQGTSMAALVRKAIYAMYPKPVRRRRREVQE